MKNLCVVSVILLSACSATTPSIEGAGFSLLTPSAPTRDFIIKNDRPFANQVAGNNRTCKRAPACSK